MLSVLAMLVLATLQVSRAQAPGAPAAHPAAPAAAKVPLDRDAVQRTGAVERRRGPMQGEVRE